MSKIYTKAALLFLLLIISQQLFATVLPIQLYDRVNGTKQIVLAKAMNAVSYWDAKKQRIYTAYTMEVRCYMKEESTVQSFQFIIPGGEVDGELEIVTPNVKIEIGGEYVLMVENAGTSSLNPYLSGAETKMPQFQPYALIQGVMEYKNGMYVDYVEGKPMDEKTMMGQIKEFTRMDPTTPSGEHYTPRESVVDADNDGVCSTLDCDDNNPNFPQPVGAPCNDGNSATKNDQIQADGCTCAGNDGQTVDCDNIIVTTEGGIIRIDNLTAQSEKIEIVGSETGGQASLICDGDCKETQYIEGLLPGHKAVRIWMTGDNETNCYREIVIEVVGYICEDDDNDNLCNIKDCAPDDNNLPTAPGTPCDDGNDNTLRDIILIDGCTCAGVEACPVEEEEEEEEDGIQDNNPSARTLAITLKNTSGVINPIFKTGTIEDENDLIIEGSGFGANVGTIEFANSDSGGRSVITVDQATDLISWTDSSIRVKIPTRTGNGTITVKNSSGVVVGSSTLKVSYAINSLYSSFRSFANKTRQNIKFTNRNEAGGYTLQLNTASNFAYSEAVPAFERAMDSWVCASGVNWQIDKAGTDKGFANDGNCVVVFEPFLPIGILGITTSRYKASGNSSCSLHNTVWYLKEFDIQFLPSESMGNLSWNFTEQPPQFTQYDFETIVLHELGHAHGLGHVIDPNEIMHYSIQNGIESRTISTHAHDGGNFKTALSVQPNCISSHEPMTPLNPGCETMVEEKSTSARVKLMLEGYFDSSSNQLKTSLLDNNLLPAEQPFSEEPYNLGQGVTVANFPTDAVDWLLLELRDANDMNTVITQKAVLINIDGTIVDLTGNSLITFDDVEDGNYYIAVFHKSHLPIITNAAQPLSSDPPIFDFSASADAAMGNDQQKAINGKYFMTSGDFDGNGIINSLDFNLWKQSGAAVNSYSPADADGNGIINSLDFNLWKANGSKVSILNRG